MISKVEIKIKDNKVVISVPIDVFDKLFESRTQNIIEQTVEQVASALTSYDNRRPEITGEDRVETSQEPAVNS